MSTPKQENRETNQPVSSRRRKLLTGTAAGTGVFLSMQAKTALGGTVCQSPSAQISGNTSPRPNESPCSGGRSPGFWMQPQHFGHWTQAGVTPPTFWVPITTCLHGLGNISPCDIQTRGKLLSDVFPGTPALGFWEVMVWPTNYPNVTNFGDRVTCSTTKSNINPFGTDGQLLRHLACAYLNAKTFVDLYPLTDAQVIDMWNQLSIDGTYCPSSLGGGDACGSKAMTKDEVKAYIENMYDINAPILNLCKE